MGRGHAASGMAAGAACVAWGLPAIGFVLPGGAFDTLFLGTILAGWSLAPDIDHPHATATTAFGPVSRFVHGVVAQASVAFTQLTGTRRDESGEHRKLTHTLIFALLVAGAVTVAGARWPRETSAVVLGIAVGILFRLILKPVGSTVAGLSAAMGVYLVLPLIPGPSAHLVGAAAGLGCVVHCWGDWITRAGIPFLAPIVTVKGKRWWNFRPPLFLTFKAGGKTENVLVTGFWLVTAAAVAHTTGII